MIRCKDLEKKILSEAVSEIYQVLSGSKKSGRGILNQRGEFTRHLAIRN
jgi:hypothetical protein